MKIIIGSFLATVLALSIAGPVQAQNPTQGDYYPFQATYVAHVTPPSMRRLDAVKTCTDGIKFDSNRYVQCMLNEGENP
jgi:hypothetical protein